MIVDLIPDRNKFENELSPSEALYGFAAWLTGRVDPITLSCVHDAAGVADLVHDFCKTNNLSDPKDDWTRHLQMPTIKSKS